MNTKSGKTSKIRMKSTIFVEYCLLLLFLFFNICFVDSTLHSCCNRVDTRDIIDIIACVNNSVSAIYSNYTNDAYILTPTLRIAVVTRSTPDIYNYTVYSYMIQALYATTHNYVMLPLWIDSDEKDYIYHRKLVPILNAMNSEDFNADYVAWMDADLIPLDQEYSIQQIVSQYSRAHIFMSADVSSIANTGFIIVRNSVWARRFLRDWLQQRHLPGVETEQLGFEAIYRSRGVFEMDEKIAILPAHVMNSIAAPMGEQLPHHQILHLAAESTTMRAAVFRAAAQELCASMTGSREPSRQLGVTREFLQQTAKTVYGQAVGELEGAILMLESQRHLTASRQSLRLLKEYRMAASKYAFAVSYQNGRIETPETQEVRTRAHILAGELALSRLAGMAELVLRELGDRRNTALAGRIGALKQQLKKDLQRLHLAKEVEISSVSKKLRTVLSSRDGYVIELLHQYSAYLAQGGLEGVESEASNGYRAEYSDLPEALKLSAELSYELLTLLIKSLPHSQSAHDYGKSQHKQPHWRENSALFSVDLPPAAAPAGSETACTARLGIGEDMDMNADLSPERQGRCGTLSVGVLITELVESLDFQVGVLLRVVHPAQKGLVEDMHSQIAQIKSDIEIGVLH